MPERWGNYAILRRDQIESGLDLTFSKVFLPWYRTFLKLHKPRSLLEVGAGSGHLAKSLFDLVSDYVAIEPSAGMCQVAAETLHSTIALRQLPIEELEIDRYYDIVLTHTSKLSAIVLTSSEL